MDPTVSVSLDKAEYQSDETMILTVEYTADPGETVTVDVTVTDAQGRTGSDTTTVTVGSGHPVAIAVSDSGGRVWVQQSDDGATAVFTAVA